MPLKMRPQKMKKNILHKRGDYVYACINDLKVAEWWNPKGPANKSNFLKRSLHKQGILQTVTINMYEGREGVILNGAEIVNACRELQVMEVPVFVVMVAPEQEGECHVLLNERRGLLTDELKRKLMRERFDYYLGGNDEILSTEPTSYDAFETEEAIDMTGFLEAGQQAFENAKPIKLMRRCVFNLPPEYRDYPEIAMEALGIKSKSLLFIELLKCCVEDNRNEAA